MNWPGAFLIYDRLARVSPQRLLPAYQYSMLLARQAEDRIWEMVLKDLSRSFISSAEN